MKILERYVLTTYLTSFALAWTVLSFVLSISILVKVTNLVADGAPIGIIGQYILSGIPEIICYTIPLALLVSALLVFGRLSADSEISAMRACGVNFLTVMRWPLLIGGLFTVLCIWLNNEVAPLGHQVRRDLGARSSVVIGLELLEPGLFISDVPKMHLYFESKEGQWLYDVLIIDNRKPDVPRQIRAAKALVSTDGSDVIVEMYQARIDPVQDDQPGAAMASKFTHVMKDLLKTKKYRKKIVDYTFAELKTELAAANSNRDNLPRKEMRQLKSQLRFELNHRLVLAAASFCFVLIGVPLGIRSHRKETTIGMAISLVIGITFFFCLILAEAIRKEAGLYPYVLVWLPVVLCFAIAGWLIPKNQ